MTRDSEDRLVEFCARQMHSFRKADWLFFPYPNKQELAAAAVSLAGLEAFGHWQELLEVAEELVPGSVKAREALFRRTEWDSSRFRNMLGEELRRHVARAS